MRTSRLVKLVAITGLVTILTLAGCAKVAPTPAPLPVPVPTPAPIPAVTPKPSPAPTGPYGQLTIAVGAAMGKLDPMLGISGAGSGLSLIFDYMIGEDGKGDLGPGVIEKWELAPDGKSWTYYVRRGIKFQNGEELTAEDVKFSFDRFTSKEVFYPALRDSVGRAEVVDDFTVRLYTIGAQPFLPYVNSLFTPAMTSVMPKDYIERVGAEYFGLHPIGSGPFKFVRDVPGDVTDFEAVEQHWRQVPAFKKLTRVLMTEQTTRKAALQTGIVDITDVDLESAAELEALGFKIINLLPDQPAVHLYATYDPRAAGMPATDIKVRQALSLAINRDELNKTLLRGRSGPLLPPYITQISADVDRAYWQDYCAKAYRYDPEEAKRLLKEAGYPQGFAIKILTSEWGSIGGIKLTEVIQGYWLRIGVTAEIVAVETSCTPVYGGIDRYYRPMIGQAVFIAVSAAPVPPPRLRAGFHSRGGLALLGKARPDVDKLIDEAQSEMNTAKRRELLAQAIKEIVDSYTFLPIASLLRPNALGPRVDLDVPSGLISSITSYLDRVKHRQP